jgi:TetR/AcrR family transcriptional regulator
MAAKQHTNSRADVAHRDGGFLSPAAIRQPADALGPRAQRTIGRIIEATRDVFLTRGYSGTTVDEIARLADVSRASFYTYFSTKREVLLALGARSASECFDVIERLPAAGATRDDLNRWVGEYFDFLDMHGSFAFAWTQAANEDDEIRAAGMKRHLSLCRQLGVALATGFDEPSEHPTELGLAVFSLLERSWNYAQLYFDTIHRQDVIDQIGRAMWGAVRQPVDPRPAT